MLINRKDICHWRRSYLRKIKEYCQANKKVYYFDEIKITAGRMTGKYINKTVESARDAFITGLCASIANNTGKGSRLITDHVCSDTSFVHGGFYVFEAQKSVGCHTGMTGEIFHDWFKGVLDMLELNCGFVMDNTPYHSVKIERSLTTAWQKQDKLKLFEEDFYRSEPGERRTPTSCKIT